MEGRLPPSFTPHPPTPLSLSLLLPVPLPPPSPSLPPEKRQPGGRGHQSSRIAFLVHHTLRWILERSESRRAPIIRHYTVTRENTFRMTIPLLPSFLSSRASKRWPPSCSHDAVHSWKRRGPNCGGPERQYLESACLRMIERASSFSYLVGMVTLSSTQWDRDRVKYYFIGSGNLFKLPRSFNIK